MEYARFTPPWLRQQLSVGDRPICYVAKVDSEELVLPDLRAQRNVASHHRMAWLLAAFYEYEPKMSRKVLDKLIQQFSSTDSPCRRIKRRQTGPTGNSGSRRKKQRDSLPNSGKEVRTVLPPSQDFTRTRDAAESSPGRVCFNGHEIFCAFGHSCRFRDMEGGQDPEGITGKCRQCQAKIHDLCAGGENSDRMCPRCKRNLG